MGVSGETGELTYDWLSDSLYRSDNVPLYTSCSSDNSHNSFSLYTSHSTQSTRAFPGRPVGWLFIGRVTIYTVLILYHSIHLKFQTIHINEWSALVWPSGSLYWTVGVSLCAPHISDNPHRHFQGDQWAGFLIGRVTIYTGLILYHSIHCKFQTIHTGVSGETSGLAYDWLSDCLYWWDSVPLHVSNIPDNSHGCIRGDQWAGLWLAEWQSVLDWLSVQLDPSGQGPVITEPGQDNPHWTGPSLRHCCRS